VNTDANWALSGCTSFRLTLLLTLIAPSLWLAHVSHARARTLYFRCELWVLLVTAVRRNVETCGQTPKQSFLCSTRIVRAVESTSPRRYRHLVRVGDTRIQNFGWTLLGKRSLERLKRKWTLKWVLRTKVDVSDSGSCSVTVLFLLSHYLLPV
jgi:hypothetical protein